MATMRLPDQDLALLRELAAHRGLSPQAVLHESLDAYRRAVLLGDLNAAFARLRRDETAWKEELQERAEWQGAGDQATEDE